MQVIEAKPRRLGFGVGVSSNTGYRVETSYRDAHFLASRTTSSVACGSSSAASWVTWTCSCRRPWMATWTASARWPSTPTSPACRPAGSRLVSFAPFRGARSRTAFPINYQHEVLIPEGSLRTSRGALTANWSWTHRNVDSVLDPRRGHVFNVQVGGASQALMSDRNFARFYGRYQRFIPAFGRDVVIVRAEGGITAAQSREGCPRISSSAPAAPTVRGYATRASACRTATPPSAAATLP